MAYLTELAKKHVADNQLRGKTPIYSAARFVRFVGDVPAEQITTEHLTSYRQKCREQQLSAQTIESSIGNIVTILKFAAGVTIDAGRPLKKKPPEPKPAELDAIAAAFEKLPDWMQLWVMFTYWTGLRLADSITALRKYSGNEVGPTIRHRAAKTGRLQLWPAPKWLTAMMGKVQFPAELCLENMKKRVRAELKAACLAAGCSVWGPKNLRQRSITEWSRANATAGAIVHGCGLGVLAHYLDPLQILESAAPRVRLPECFGACTQAGAEDTLISNFRRLDPAAQSLIVGTTERLAAS